jgi:hypothetical protein
MKKILVIVAVMVLMVASMTMASESRKCIKYKPVIKITQSLSETVETIVRLTEEEKCTQDGPVVPLVNVLSKSKGGQIERVFTQWQFMTQFHCPEGVK